MIDNQSWILIHCHLTKLVSFTYIDFFKQVTKGRGYVNLIKMIMDALKKHIGVFEANVATKLLSFGVDNANVF
jgi:hypothetical protein